MKNNDLGIKVAAAKRGGDGGKKKKTPIWHGRDDGPELQKVGPFQRTISTQKEERSTQQQKRILLGGGEVPWG